MSQKHKKYSFNTPLYLKVLSIAILSLIPLLMVVAYQLSERLDAMQGEALRAFENETGYLHRMNWALVGTDANPNYQRTLERIQPILELDSVMWFSPDFQLMAHLGNDRSWSQLPKQFKSQGVYLNEDEWSSVQYVYDSQGLQGILRTSKTIPTYTDVLRDQGVYVSTLAVTVLGVLGLFFFLTLNTLKRSLNKIIKLTKKGEGKDKLSSRAFNRSLGSLGPYVHQWYTDYESNLDREQKNVSQLNQTLAGSGLVEFSWRLDKDEIVFSKRLRTLLGYLPNEGVLSLEEFVLKIHEEDLDNFQLRLSEHLKHSTEYFNSTVRFANAGAEYVWLHFRGQVVERSTQGKPLFMVGTVCEVNQQKQREVALELIQDAFNFTNEAMVITDPNLRIFEVNKAFTKMTGFTLEQVKGKPIECLYSNQHPPSYYTNIRSTLELRHHWQGEIIQQKRSGGHYPTLLTISSMQDKEGNPRHFIAMFVDQTAQTQQQDRIEFLASYDSLTRLVNREQFTKQVEKALHVNIQANDSVALMIIGINNFKLMNDTFGYSIGDELLVHTAHRLQEVMPPQSLLSRLSGDEFGLFIENVNDDLLEDLAHEVLHSLQEPFNIDSQEIVISSCIGISLCPQDGKTMDELLVNADTALIHAKKNERNSYQFFTPSMNEEVQARQKLETYLRTALEKDEFKLYYQPKVDIKSGRVIGAEALLRWPHPELDFVSPDVFVPIAEETGLIIPISEWVFRQACVQGQLWRNQGWKDFSISVNVSGTHFKKDDFAEFMQKLLHETGFPASFLDLEITEGALVADIEHCILILKVLKSMGMTLSIDDFGTGYSSLSYLRKFPVNTLKVDRSFVQNMMHNKEDANITRAVIAMAKGLQLKTVAEGVETIEQLNALKQLECDYVQGFYYSKALPPEAFEQFFIEQNKKAMAS